MPSFIQRPNGGEPWTAVELELLTKMVADGSTIPAIASALGRSQEAVRNRAQITGLMAKRRTK